MNKILVAIFILASSFAVAQETKQDTTQLNEIIIAENRLQTPFSKQARNIQIITKAQISALPVKSINEVLSFIGGVDVRQRGPFGAQADVSIDGGSFEQTLILLNGVKISDVQTGHHSMNIPVPLAAVERIEVLKGPAARIYGVNALTGAVNIVTKTADKTAITLNVQTGSSFEEKALGDGDGIYAGAMAQMVLNMAGKNHQHLVAFGLTNTSGQRYNSATENHKFFYQGNMDFSAKNKLHFMAGYINSAFGANGFYAAPGDRESFERVETALFSVASHHQLGNHFKVMPRLSSRYNWDDYRYFRNDLTKGRSQHRTKVWSAEINSTLNTAMGDFGFGAESRSENIESTNVGNRQRYNHGLFAEYKTEAIKKLLLNIGSYVNYNTDYGWQAFPGVDVAYLFAPKWTAAFNVGASQRIPSFTDLYLSQQPGNIGNPNLNSENAWQYEASLSYKHNDLQLRGGYFYRNISNFIDWIRSSSAVPYQPQNFGNNKVHGLNIGLSQRINLSAESNFTYTLSYHYLYAGNTKYAANFTSKYLIESLRYQALMRLIYGYRNWQATVGNRWIERVANNPYLITDLRLQYGKKQWSLYAEVTNLLNKAYVEVGAVPLPGRWYALGVNYQWGL